jgi:hypothetical protein
MQHIIRYEGGYERNFGTLRSQGSEYEGDDGNRHAAQPWPTSGDGVRFSFMEQPGKRFVAVRVQYEGDDVVLKHPVRLDPERHLGGKRFSAQPLTIADGPAGTLFSDILEANREQNKELTAIRKRVRRAIAGRTRDENRG